MVNAQNIKVVTLNVGALSSTAAAVSDYVDTRDYHYATFIVVGPKATATNSSQTFTSLKLTNGNTTSSFANVSGYVGATAASATEFVLPINNDTAAWISVLWHVDLRRYNTRYYQVSGQTPAAGYTSTTIVCLLTRGDKDPNTAAEHGVLAQVVA